MATRDRIGYERAVASDGSNDVTGTALAARDIGPQPSGARRRPAGAVLSESEAAALLSAIAEHADRTAFALLFRYFAPRLKAFALRSGVSLAAHRG